MRQIAFWTKLFQFKSRLIAKAGVPLSVTANRVSGKRIGMQSGSQFETYAQMNWQPAVVDVMAYQSQEGVFDDLMAGRLDGALLGFGRSGLRLSEDAKKQRLRIRGRSARHG